MTFSYGTRPLQIGFAGLFLVLLFQNCGQPFAVKELGGASLSATDGTPRLPLSTPTPAPVNRTPMASWEEPFPALERADDCLTNPAFTLCLPYKDPLTTYGQPFAPAFTTTTATQQQEKSVFVYGLRAPILVPQNQHFRIDTAGTSLQRVQVTANANWKHRLQNDTSHYVSQLNMFYIVNRQRTYMTERTGAFFYQRNRTGAQIALRPYVATDPNGAAFENASFSQIDGSLTFGFWLQGSQRADFSLDGSVIAHEAGHGNLHFALPAAARMAIDPNLKRDAANRALPFCRTANGCFSAIHEAVADVHAFVLYPDKSTALAPYVVNNPAGFQNRNPAANLAANLSATALYNGSGGGEIHVLGSVYAMIWYDVWKKAKDQGLEKDIERVLTEHLADLSPSDTFLTAFSTISANATMLFPGARGTQITSDFRAAYLKVGLTPP